jgi:hypothetical protein
VARAIVVAAFAVTFGLGCVVALGVGAHPGSVPGPDRPHAPVTTPAPASARPAEAVTRPDPAATTRRQDPQDPQDRPGTAAHRRAGRELATHRALQHIPWHRGGVSIRLVGAAGGKAVLEVEAPDIVADRLGWRAFLRRFHDDGRSYVARLLVDPVRAHPRGGR